MTRAHRPVLLLAALAAWACASKRLPPGTPPPEYEVRELPPWSGEADAGPGSPPAEPGLPAEVTAAPPEAPPPAPEPVPLDAGASPSPDAGVR